MTNAPIKVASLLAALVLVEELPRMVGLGNPVLLQADPSCQYFVRPNQYHYRFLVHTRINAYGMRSDDFQQEKPDGTYRIMFLGDSIVYGTTRIDQSKIFTEILHRELPSIFHRPTEVLNASANAWAIPNELAYLKSRGTFHSDLVLLVLNEDDLDQALSTANDVGSAFYFKKPACAICELVQHYSMVRKVDAGTTLQINIPQEDANLRDLDTLREIVLSSGAKFAILFVPFRKDISSSRPTVIQSKLVNWAESRRVLIIDTTPRLARLTIKEASVDGGIHLSAAGNRAVANAVEHSADNLQGRWLELKPAQSVKATKAIPPAPYI